MPVTLDNIASVANGARFFTADLHGHSVGASSDVSDAAMTVDAIIEAALAQQIALLAFTDHNTDANLAWALDYALKYAGQLLVLPATEITTAILSLDGKHFVRIYTERAPGLKKSGGPFVAQPV